MFSDFYDFIFNIIESLGIWGPFLGCIFIVIESVLPILPLALFITINFLSFGTVIGFIISWIFTIIGCCLSFFLFRKGLKNWFEIKRSNKVQIDKIMNFLERVSFPQLTTIIAIPFTPAFAVNIAAGLSNISFKKYFISLIIGKIFLVFFWGFVGTTLIQSLTHPLELLKVIVLILAAYIVSVIINKKYDLD